MRTTRPATPRSRIYADLLRTHGETEGRELWTQALNELDDANGVERADGES